MSIVAIVVVVRVYVSRIDVQIVHVVAIVVSRRPPVTVATLIVRRATVVVA